LVKTVGENETEEISYLVEWFKERPAKQDPVGMTMKAWEELADIFNEKFKDLQVRVESKNEGVASDRRTLS
jgi:hypothetical protein